MASCHVDMTAKGGGGAISDWREEVVTKWHVNVATSLSLFTNDNVEYSVITAVLGKKIQTLETENMTTIFLSLYISVFF